MANERILIVDDEKNVVHSCARILERHGFVVTGITNSPEVPDLLRQQTFDLLLTDIRMPKMNGLDLLRQAKEIDPHLTVVLITGYGTMEDAIRAIHLGAQGFLMKPFDTEDLIATIEDSLTRRALLRDSLRLQTLLPLLEINQTLQRAEDATTLTRRVLQIAHRETRAGRITWYSRPASMLPLAAQISPLRENEWGEIAVVSINNQPTTLSPRAIDQVFSTAQPAWILTNGTIINNREGQSSIVASLLPVIIKGEVTGVLTAEIGEKDRAPFDPISLDLLSVLVGQLAMIIENVQLFEQTRALHAFNEDIIQNITAGLIAINQEGVITAFNPAAAAMLGCRAEQLHHHPLQNVVSGAQELIDAFQDTLATGQPNTYHEIVIRRADGTQLPLSVKTAPLATGAARANAAGVVGLLEDLSERKAIEAERRRLDRLAALGEMSAVVAHEIRNPVASIAAGVDYLSVRMTPDSAEAHGAAMIQREIQRVNRILEDILFVARPFQLDLSTENLAEIIDDVLQRCQSQIQAGQVKVTTHHTPDLPPLWVDRQRLEQVFTNLIINAAQAMQTNEQSPAERQLTIQSCLVTTTGNIAPKDNLPNHVIITFTDTGPGIPPDAQQRIFEPFFTTKARGSGLGLSVARRVIEEHRGTIEIDPHPTRGTRFIITLPVKKETR
jgi:PAS domain S-box-containing protein